MVYWRFESISCGGLMSNPKACSHLVWLIVLEGLMAWSLVMVP